MNKKTIIAKTIQSLKKQGLLNEKKVNKFLQEAYDENVYDDKDEVARKALERRIGKGKETSIESTDDLMYSYIEEIGEILFDIKDVRIDLVSFLKDNKLYGDIGFLTVKGNPIGTLGLDENTEDGPLGITFLNENEGVVNILLADDFFEVKKIYIAIKNCDWDKYSRSANNLLIRGGKLIQKLLKKRGFNNLSTKVVPGLSIINFMFNEDNNSKSSQAQDELKRVFPSFSFSTATGDNSITFYGPGKIY